MGGTWNGAPTCQPNPCVQTPRRLLPLERHVPDGAESDLLRADARWNLGRQPELRPQSLPAGGLLHPGRALLPGTGVSLPCQRPYAEGPGTTCLNDNDKDGIDDACEPMLLKFIQPYDVNRTGLDIKATPTNILADDFLCTRQTLITNITIWGSWMNDYLPYGDAGNVTFTLSIHADGMAGPGMLLWVKTFAPGSFTTSLAFSPTEETFWDPASGATLVILRSGSTTS